MSPRLIMVGPSVEAHGGIASVAATLLAEPRLGRFNIEYVTTWSDGDAYHRFSQGVRGLARLARLAHRNDLVHVHTASRGSFARKAAAVAIARFRGARVLLHLHGGEFHRFYGQASRPTQMVVRWVFRTADAVIVL
ncbi:MAG: glycosyltransferase, partial [Candidatus Nanopelagicales bacterium]